MGSVPPSTSQCGPGAEGAVIGLTSVMAPPCGGGGTHQLSVNHREEKGEQGICPEENQGGVVRGQGAWMLGRKKKKAVEHPVPL